MPALSRDDPRPLNNEVTKIIKAARPILASVITNPGYFNQRVSDTRTRKHPTIGDITNINGAIDVLIKENNGSSNIIDPAQDPFICLWLANCVLYSVVIAFFVMKGCRKRRDLRAGKAKLEKRKKKLYETQAGAIRNKTSL